MRPEPVADPLALWRGIDDAVWREAVRALPQPAKRLPIPALTAPPQRPAAIVPVAKVPEPA